MPFAIRPKEIVRRLAGSPGFTAVALITIAAAVGANSAMFGVINAVLLKPLPYAGANRLVSLSLRAPGLRLPQLSLAPSLYFTYRDHNKSFDNIGLWASGTASVTGIARPEQVPAVVVTGAALPLLRVQPALGRVLAQPDDEPGAPKTVVLSYGFWQREFGGDPRVVGRSLRVDGELRRIIGILPQNFRFLDQTPALYTTFQFDRAKLHLGNFSYDGLGRLRPGVSMQQAEADLSRLIPVYLRSFSPPAGFSVQQFESVRLTPWVRPLSYDVTGDIGSTLWLIMATLGLVLLIASANVANLLLVRAEGRRREIAVRASLGASRLQLAGDILAESLALGVVGGLIGLVLADGGLRLLVAAAPRSLPRLTEIAIDSNTILFTLAISVVAGVLLGFLPAWKYSHTGARPGIGQSDRSGTLSRERHFTRNGLVVLQVTLALILLVSSGLMIRTVLACSRVALGFADPAHLETFQLSIAEAEIQNPALVEQTERAILERIRTLPGVAAAAMTSRVPMDNSGSFDMVFARDRSYSAGQVPIHQYEYVSPGFFRAMGIPMLAGRDYMWADLEDRSRVTIVSEALAKEYWGSAENALGKQVRGAATEPWREVVGVAANVHFDGVNKPVPSQIYWPLLLDQFEDTPVRATRDVKYVIRSNRAGQMAFADELRGAVWSVDAALPVAEMSTEQMLVARSLATMSFTLVMLSIAAGMALLLGLVGIYGVIAYSVTQRRREIGVRVAIGASPMQVINLFLRSGVLLTALGVGIGVIAAAGLTQVMSSLLFGVTALDVPTYCAASLALLGTALLASYVPSRRALRVDPAESLRAD